MFKSVSNLSERIYLVFLILAPWMVRKINTVWRSYRDLKSPVKWNFQPLTRFDWVFRNSKKRIFQLIFLEYSSKYSPKYSFWTSHIVTSANMLFNSWTACGFIGQWETTMWQTQRLPCGRLRGRHVAQVWCIKNFSRGQESTPRPPRQHTKALPHALSFVS